MRARSLERLVAALLVAATAVQLAGCTSVARRSESHSNERRAIAREMWLLNERLVRQELKKWGEGEEVDLRAVTDAAIFLSTVSGIDPPAGNYLGILPSQELEAAFNAWVAWFRRNGRCLDLFPEGASIQASVALCQELRGQGQSGANAPEPWVVRPQSHKPASGQQ